MLSGVGGQPDVVDGHDLAALCDALASPAAAGVELTGLERTRPDLPRIEAAGPEQATSGPTTRQPPEPRDVDTPGREAPAGQQGDDPEPGQPGPAT